jgi:chaperonin GroES
VATSKKKSKKPAAKKASAKKTLSKKAVVKKVLANKGVPKKSAAKKGTVAKPKALAKVLPLKKATSKVTLGFITPLEDRLIVVVDGPSDKTPGGLYIPETAADRPHRGRVVALGRGRRNKKGLLRPLDVSSGDTVLFNEYAGTKITVEGEEFLILREEDVLGIVT